ncbi:TIGR03086 family protein [Nakamurella flava]|uniref:TIGR03086 family protein n=1 Tax=Nakamurella flava TaxID=2576308 RepID=A0A4U6QLW0_9ACTN|nr:TIGR03086 family metal-binding protein [Nakamurella flava]TKV61523.1 TIGR03086 family protein [Nakamurella flava]
MTDPSSSSPGFDLGEAADRLSRVVSGIRDDQLSAPTPCPDYTVGDLLEHVIGLTRAFTEAAAPVPPSDVGGHQPPAGDAARLPADWRARLSRDLPALAHAWRQPGAWSGMRRAGGIDMPAEVAAVVAIDEIALHAWDLAVSTGQDYEPDPATLPVVQQFVASFDDDNRAGLFGPAVTLPAPATRWDRVLGQAGRNPRWTSPGQ